MLNIINPVTNMNGGGNGQYFHYISMSGRASEGGYFSVCFLYISKKSTPFSNATELYDDFIEKGFVREDLTKQYAIPAYGTTNSGTEYIMGIFAMPDSQIFGFLIKSSYYGTAETDTLNLHDYVV